MGAHIVDFHLLALMGQTGLLLDRFHRADVHKMCRGKILGLFPAHDLIEIEFRGVCHAQPGVIGKHGAGAVVFMGVDGLMGEQQIGAFGIQ